MKANVVVFDRRIELNRYGDQTEGEDAAGDGPSHPVRVSCRWMADLQVADDSGSMMIRLTLCWNGRYRCLLLRLGKG